MHVLSRPALRCSSRAVPFVLVLALLLAALATVACTVEEDPEADTLDTTSQGDAADSTTTDTADVVSTPVSAFAADLADALCAVNARCDLGLFPAETARCLEAQHQLLGIYPPDSTAVQLDTAQAQRCLDAIDTLVCAEADRLFYDDLGIMKRICPAAVVGTVAEGELCYAPGECSPGLACDLRDGDFPTCPGTCVALQGHACPGDVDPPDPSATVCAPDEFCDATNTCVPRGETGASCRPELNDCAFGFHCNLGTCAPDLEVGESCADLSDGTWVDCAQHLHCVDEVCQFATWGAGLGEACGLLVNCGNGLFCSRGDSSDGICQAVAELGEACGDGTAPDGAWRPCAADLYCHAPAGTTTGTCAALLAPGEACERSSGCRGGACEDGVCAAGPSCARP